MIVIEIVAVIVIVTLIVIALGNGNAATITACGLALAACGPAHVFHKDPERGCVGPVVLAAREDVAAVAGCARLGSITIRPAGPLDLSPLGRLEAIDGDLRVGPSVGLSELALPRLETVTGTLRVGGNGDLHRVLLPRLARAGRVEIEGNAALTNLSLPGLAATDALIIADDPALEIIDVARLAAVGDELVIANNRNLALVEGGPIAAPRRRIEGNDTLAPDVRDRLQGGASQPSTDPHGAGSIPPP